LSEEVEVHLGIDDTDSIRGGCTTYVASLIAEALSKMGVSFIDYPCLIRLNPNVPWKTRGNGAVALRFKVLRRCLDEAVNQAVKIVKEHSELEDPATNPAVAVLTGPPTPMLKRLAKKALSSVVDLEEALSIAQQEKVELYFLKQPRGIIGALAAIGEVLEGDHTYELIAYRLPEHRGSPRKVDEESVVEMDLATRPYTFNNIDLEEGRVLITPRGPDPVLYGIRGEDPSILKQAQKLLRVHEPVERWTIFRTNQGTDAHLTLGTTQARPYEATAIRGVVDSKPVVIKGGHVIFKLRDHEGLIHCAAYEPTGSFRKLVKQLHPGDEVLVYGGIRPPGPTNPKTLNLEKLLIVKLATIKVSINPACPACGTTLKSMGRSKGYRCRKCGVKYPHLEKKEVVKPRGLAEALYIPPPRAHRHLTKPYSRYGREKAQPAFKAPLNPSEFLWIRPAP